MILEHEQWIFGYDQILKDCRPGSVSNNDYDGGARTALLLCNADVDAMSSARILSYMLRSDGVHYQLLPCTCYSDLEEQLSTMVDEGAMDDVSSIVLFNFGAARNLTKLYENDLLKEGSVKVYVMDCRRPIHLANVYSPSSVVVFLDSTQQQKDMPSDGDNLSGDESSSSDEDDSDESDEDSLDNSFESNDEHEKEEEARFDDVVGEKSNTPETTNETKATEDVDSSSLVRPSLSSNDIRENAIRKSNNDDDATYDAEDEKEGIDDDTNDEDDENYVARESKRQKTDDVRDTENIESASDRNHDDSQGIAQDATSESQLQSIPLNNATMVSPRELHSQRRNRLRKYYTDGSFYGSPAAFVAYRLASQHRYGEQGDLLWLACVGVTDAYLHARLDLIGYAKLAKELGDLCNKLFPNSVFDRALNTVYAEDLVGKKTGLLRNNSTSSDHQNKTKIALSEYGRIFSEKDFRFFMLRHSSLLDSMQYSEYVCTRLQVYTKKGEQKLMEMLAKMGYPLDECRQPFPFMRPSLRRRLKEKLGTHAQVSLRS